MSTNSSFNLNISKLVQKTKSQTRKKNSFNLDLRFFTQMKASRYLNEFSFVK
jgi:hypothetical protein